MDVAFTYKEAIINVVEQIIDRPNRSHRQQKLRSSHSSVWERKPNVSQLLQSRRKMFHFDEAQLKRGT